MTKIQQKCENFKNWYLDNYASQKYCRHGFEKPLIHTFQEKNFGQHLVNTCWLNVYIPYPYGKCPKNRPPTLHTWNLVNRCWLNVDQIYFFGNYDIRAFQRRVGRPCIPLSHWNLGRNLKIGFLRSPFSGV